MTVTTARDDGERSAGRVEERNQGDDEPGQVPFVQPEAERLLDADEGENAPEGGERERAEARREENFPDVPLLLGCRGQRGEEEGARDDAERPDENADRTGVEVDEEGGRKVSADEKGRPWRRRGSARPGPGGGEERRP